MNAASFWTSSTVTALYKEARIPPTDLNWKVKVRKKEKVCVILKKDNNIHRHLNLPLPQTDKIYILLERDATFNSSMQACNLKKLSIY